SAISAYRVTPYLNGNPQTPRTFNSTATAQTVSSLTNGQSYTFTIAAINAKGVGLPSAATTAITIGAPTAPSSPVASPANGAARLAWTKPNNNGTVITAYEITPSLNGVAQPPQLFGPTSTAQTVTGLTNGRTYTFTIAA